MSRVRANPPGGPKECRQRAANCRRLAQSATLEKALEAFLNLAGTWDKLAAELERAQRFILAQSNNSVPPLPGDEAPRCQREKSGGS
jgi:hypothetical protein